MAQLIPIGSAPLPGSPLEEALRSLEDCYSHWAGSTDFPAVLRRVFASQSPEAAGALGWTISGEGLVIPLEILDDTSLAGLNAAYTSAAPSGGERIVVRAGWLAVASVEQIIAVLLEEIGHAIDQRLNGSGDTPGDEGEIFSALLRAQAPATSAFAEDDHRLINLQGSFVPVEASVDITPPRGSFGSLATAPAYAPASTNPFGISDVGYQATLEFADVDGDGDLDLFIGNHEGNTLFFRNTAGAGASAPAFASPSTNPFGITTVAFHANPALADVDGDGDLDLFIGNSSGNTFFFRNTAGAGATAPAFAAPSTNPFGISDVGSFSSPAFADADGDGDLDLFISERYGKTFFFRNTSSTAATPAYAAAIANPFGISDVGSNAIQAFADADRDGDLDLFIGNYLGNTLFFRNSASPGAIAPAYAPAATNPFGISDVGSFASPTFADADGDGDLDLFIGEFYGNTLFFRNIAATPVAPVRSSNTNGRYGIGATIILTLQFSEPVLVSTTGGTPTLQLETGNIDRVATYFSGSGSDTLSFRYIVQAGDSSADLDQLSSSALRLNGGTIRDAAGNNAILSLAASGATGSLGANAQLVIDGIAPTGSFSSSIVTDTGLVPAISSGGYTSDNTLGLSGSYADANGVSAVEIFDGTTKLGNASLSNGSWTFITPALADGLHSFSASVIDGAGNRVTLEPARTATLITSATTIQGVSLFSTSQGYALLSGTSAPRQVTYPGGNASASNPGNGWRAVAAVPTASGFGFYWANSGSGQAARWELDPNGVYSSGYLLSPDQLRTEEASLNRDLNGDGYTSGPSTIQAVNLGSTAQGYALLSGTNAPLQVSYPGGNASASNPGNGWRAVAAAPTASGFAFYWANSGSGQAARWDLDSSGVYSSGYLLSPAQLHTEEASLNRDLNGDGYTSGPSTIQAVNLGSTSQGYALLSGTNAPLQVSYPGGNASASNPGYGWRAVAAAPTASGFAFYWANSGSGQAARWDLDSSGVYSSGYLLSPAQLRTEEASLNRDLNGDGYISGPRTIQGVNLGSTSQGYALLSGTDAPLQVTYPGGNASANNPGNGWSAVAAVTTASGFAFYWTNSGSGQAARWELDANGVYQSGALLSASQLINEEPAVNADLNGDSIIGPAYITIENQGNASLLRQSDGFAAVQVGTTLDPVTSPFGLGTGDASSTWQMLAAETVEGQNRILWRNNPDNFLHLWTLSSSWSWQSSYGTINPASADALGLEINFQLDLNGDGLLG